MLPRFSQRPRMLAAMTAIERTPVPVASPIGPLAVEHAPPPWVYSDGSGRLRSGSGSRQGAVVHTLVLTPAGSGRDRTASSEPAEAAPASSRRAATMPSWACCASAGQPTASNWPSSWGFTSGGSVAACASSSTADLSSRRSVVNTGSRPPGRLPSRQSQSLSSSKILDPLLRPIDRRTVSSGGWGAIGEAGRDPRGRVSRGLHLRAVPGATGAGCQRRQEPAGGAGAQR